VILVALVLAAGIVLAVVWQRSTDVLLRSRIHRKVVVELRSGETFDGIIAKTDRHSVLLQSVRLLAGAETQPTRIDGELLLPRCDVKFIQRP
jgi:small nuclear ribonucleoprotein (snRNP)-like protein